MNGAGPRGAARAVRALVFSCLAGLAATACATTPSVSSQMPAGGVAMPPAGLFDMCRRMPDICGQDGVAAAEEAGPVLASAGTDMADATGATPAYPDHAKAVQSTADPIAPGALGEAGPDGEFDMGGEIPLQSEQRGPARSGVPVSTLALTEDGRLASAPALFATLNRVNQSINMQIRPRNDLDLHGMADFWTLPLTRDGTAEGDCEDYALEKRRALLEEGVPETALFLAVGYSAATGRHAVLVVRTDQGDYVLDNMTPYILPWAETPYRWIARQMPGDLLSWRHMINLTS